MYQSMIDDGEFMSALVSRTRLQPYPMIVLNNGIEIGFRNASKMTRILGEKLAFLALDESQDILESEFYKVLYPMLIDTPGSIGTLAGTSRPGNWLYSHYEEGLKNPKKIRSFMRRTDEGPMFEGPDGRAAYADAISRMTELDIRREFLCEPVQAEDAVFRHLDRALVDVIPPTGPIPGHYYVMGLDVGKVVNPCAVVVIDQTINQVCYVEEFPLGQLHEESAKRAREIATHWRCLNSVVVDCTKQGDSNTTGKYDRYVQFYRQFLPQMREYIWSPANIDSIISTITLQIEQKKITIPRCFVPLVKQMMAYTYKYNGVYVHYGAVKGCFDDCVAGFVMSALAVVQKWFSMNPSTLIGAFPAR